MKSTLTNKIICSGLLAIIVIVLTQCTSSSSGPEWQKKNKELIAEHKLTVRELSGLPKNSIESNIEEAKVKSLDNLDSIMLQPGVNAKIFWGSGTMVGVLQLTPNAQIPEKHYQPTGLYLYWKDPSIN